ncbi:unnamed protein product, partial [marine sediment metagenome]
YHGFILCGVDRCSVLINDLVDKKNETKCSIGDRIHFTELTSRSTGSPSTKTAVKWVKLFRDICYINMWFYLLGINLTNINFDAFGPKSDGRDRHFRIYNKFFEIGLFSACRWFFNSDTIDVEITNIFAEKRNLEKHNPFTFHTPYRINQRESNIAVKTKHIIQISSTPSKERNYSDYVHILNLADVLVGSFSEVLDYTSTQNGCIEVAEKLYSICDRLSKKPFNKRSRYYKKYAISFFPKYKLKLSEILESKTNQLNNQFYNERQLCLRQPRLL